MVVGHPSPTFFADLPTPPNREFEKVASVYSVIQDLPKELGDVNRIGVNAVIVAKLDPAIAEVKPDTVLVCQELVTKE